MTLHYIRGCNSISTFGYTIVAGMNGIGINATKVNFLRLEDGANECS